MPSCAQDWNEDTRKAAHMGARRKDYLLNNVLLLMLAYRGLSHDPFRLGRPSSKGSGLQPDPAHRHIIVRRVRNCYAPLWLPPRIEHVQEQRHEKGGSDVRSRLECAIHSRAKGLQASSAQSEPGFAIRRGVPAITDGTAHSAAFRNGLCPACASRAGRACSTPRSGPRRPSPCRYSPLAHAHRSLPRSASCRSSGESPAPA